MINNTWCFKAYLDIAKFYRYLLLIFDDYIITTTIFYTISRTELYDELSIRSIIVRVFNVFDRRNQNKRIRSTINIRGV